MKKLINMIVVIIMATNLNVFAQKIDENTLAANYSHDVHKRLIKKTFDLMTHFERILVVQTLREYQTKIDLKLDTITLDNLEDIMIGRSTVVTGDRIPGPVRAYEFSKDGYGDARSYWLTYDSDDKFISLIESGLPYVQIKGEHPYTKPEPVVVRRTSIPGNTTPTTPLVIETPMPKPVPTQTVAQQPVQSSGCTTIVNNYVSSGGDNHSCSNGGCANYGCVELAARVYPINYFEAPTPPRPPYGSRNCNNGNGYYGNGYGNGGASVGVSVWWNGGYYYPYNNYWYCRNTGKQVCADDYSYLCKKYGSPTIQQNSNTYNGPHKSTVSNSPGKNMIFSNPRR